MPNRLPADSSKKTIRRASSKNPSRRPPRHRFVKDLQSLGYEKIIGIDEVGRGAIAGPLVVAAVEIYPRLSHCKEKVVETRLDTKPVKRISVRKSCYQPINGINDSKLVSASRREFLAGQIKQYALQIAFGSASNDEIDQLGLSAAQNLAYQRCLAGVKFDLLLTDHLHLAGGGGFISADRGDSLFYPVAAASIVAKVYRDQLMSVYHLAHPEYCWRQNAGYGTPAHQKALDAIGPCSLHRQSFLH